MLGIADDLTGALEVGAKFAERGLQARVTCSVERVDAVGQVLVVDSETRHLSADMAGQTVRRIAGAYRPELVYKKTDSTLRGNIASELRALAETFPQRDLVYVPAYPKIGRTVRDGCLLVGGVPVHQTEFSADLLNPIAGSDIRLLLGNLPSVILDGETDEDVLRAARELAFSPGTHIVAGPGAIAGALAECFATPGESPPSLPHLHRVLVVNGSLHPASLAQIEFASKHGCFDDGWQLFDSEGQHAGLARARSTGESVRQVLSSATFDGIIVFGGDTAFGIHQALGGEMFESLGELLPGVPLSRSGNLYWITKAGGFGEPDIICELRKRLA